MKRFEQAAQPEASASPVRAPSLREASFADYPGIAAVQERNGLAVRPRREWLQLWQGNPVYDGSSPIGWVLENEHGEIVGSIGNLPFTYHLGGQTVRAAAATDWAVDRPYRAHSLQLLHQLSNQRRVDLLICTTVSESSQPGYHAFRWSRVPAGNWDRAAFWITGYRGFLTSSLRKHGTPLAGLLGYPASIAVACRDRVKHGVWHATETGVEIQSKIEPRFQEFWEALKAENSGVLLGLRAPDFLAWHLGEALARGEVWIAAASKASRLVAYAIAKRHDSPSYGLKRMRLVDAQALRGSEAALEAALGCLLGKCRREGIHVLETVGDWLSRPGCPRLTAPYQRAFPAWAYYYKAGNSRLGAVLADPAVWSPTALDGDQAL